VEGLDRVEKGEIDLMPDVAYTADRAKIYSFHKVPVLSSWYQVYAPKGNNIHSILDLNDKRILVLERSVQQQAFTRLSKGFGLNITLIGAPDYKTMFEKVARREADAAITNSFYGMMHAKKFGLEDTAVVFEPSDLFFAAPKNAPRQLLDSIDSNLDGLKKDTKSMYYASLKRWTSEEVQYKLPVWLQIFGLIVGVVLLMSLVGSMVLKHQVNVRTQELRKSEKKYRDIFENAVMGIYQSTPEGKYRDVNPALAHIFGYKTPEEVIASVHDIQRELYVNPVDRTKLINIFNQEGFVKGFQVEYKRRDGSRFWISISGKAIRDEEGNILYYEGTIEDITQQKQAEAELIQYREHLEELVRERTAELEIAKTKAESADRLKSAFLATMSHELRTPLNSIIGFTGILIQRLGGPLNEEQDKQLNMVYNSAKHLLELINDVLDISKIEAEQLKVVSETFDLRDSLEKVIKSTRPLADKKGLELSVSVASEIGLIKSDCRRVEQILLNLISNSIKFTEQGFVRMNCEFNENKVIIAVKDSGIGIKQEDMDILFKAFQQIETGITRKYDGTGLGLSICKKLAHLLGGEIEVVSEWGVGSTFSLILPKEGEMG
jgi:PAS domain S-box-containing protein